MLTSIHLLSIGCQITIWLIMLGVKSPQLLILKETVKL